MDLNALMQAAMQDPKAAAFLQQMLAGGTSMDQRLPKIAPQELRVPKIASPEAPLPVFDQAQSSMDELLGRWGPGAAGGEPQQPGGFEPQPMDVSGMSATSLGGSGIPPEDPGMIGQMEGPAIPPVDPITQTTLPPPGQEQGDDLISLLGRVLGRGGA